MTVSKLKSVVMTANQTLSPLILFWRSQNAQGIISIEELNKEIVHSVLCFSWQQR